MTAIKFCGISHVEDAQAANAVAPEYVGFVFWPKSKRLVSAELASELRQHVDDSIKSVGVYVDEKPEVVAEHFKQGIISIAQLHGSEDEAYIEQLRNLAPGIEIWKAFEIADASDIASANKSIADVVLLDAGKGAGKAFDWSLLTEITRPFALAGGLDAELVEGIKEQLDNPQLLLLLDVSSGIENGEYSEGRPLKSQELMERFAQAIRKERNR